MWTICRCWGSPGQARSAPGTCDEMGHRTGHQMAFWVTAEVTCDCSVSHTRTMERGGEEASGRRREQTGSLEAAPEQATALSCKRLNP